ncbi:MAG: 5-methylthioadenosine/S-adenosylhomocysteine deaminase [Thermotogaceae bacterium]|nr:5-methylthioadenosine/S-adenosylhomocysteine deaminase [Thermotogaceae bacterium]
MSIKVLDKAYILHGKRIKKGHILIEKNLIKKIEEGHFKNRDYTSFEYYDLENKLILPGFANTHTHSPMVLLRGLVDNKPLKEWLGLVLERENKMTKKAIYWATILAQMEMVSRGITVFGDMYFHIEEMAKAVEDFGMKAFITRGLVDIDGDLESRLSENLRVLNDYFEHPRIKIGLGPHAPYTCSKEGLKKIAQISKELNIKIMIHLLETSWEKESYDLNDLLETGVLSNNTLGVHLVNLDEEDIKILADTGVKVVTCPISNLKLYNGISPIGKILDKGIEISLGTDGASSNNSLDIWKELTTFDLIHRDEFTLEPFELIEIATINGYRAMGFKDAGMIEEGFKADLVVIDISKPHYFPQTIDRLLSHVVYSGNSGDIFATMVDGRWLYFDGIFKTVDFEIVLKEAEKAFMEVEEN